MARVLQIATFALLAWFVYSQLNRLTWLFVLALMLSACLNALTVWMVRARPAQLASLSRRRFIDRYVRFVCFFSGDQAPSDAAVGGAVKRLLLHSAKDFQVAGYRARQILRGHDHVVDGVLSAIHQNHRLRNNRKGGTGKGPLASFLLVGNEGIGKRYLTRVLAKLLYRSGGVEVFDCDRLAVDSLVGTKSTDGDLLEAVGAQPCSVVLFERVERASADIQSILSKLLATGKLRRPGSDADVSFANAVIVLTTSRAVSSLAAIDETELSPGAWHARAMELVRDESLIDRGVLSALTDIHYMRSPDSRTRAEVVALLMKKECSDHDVRLTHVDAAVLATQVLRFSDTEGFAMAPQQVQKLLSKPLVAATENKQKALSLRVRR
jgi:hypothetical protein